MRAPESLKPVVVQQFLKDAGVDPSPDRAATTMPRMNVVVEHWVGTCRRELLDRMLIWNKAHLLHALREFENHYNSHRPHRSLARLTHIRASLYTPPTLESFRANRDPALEAILAWTDELDNLVGTGLRPGSRR